MTHEQEREAFEAWALGPNAPLLPIEKYMSGQYKETSTADAWEVWQARASLAQPASVPAEHLPTEEDIRELAQEALDQIMEQAQVFASAWSLVGGRFDSGNAMSDAEDAKAELRTMVRSLADLAAETVRPQAPQPAQADHVGDTKFEGWLSCFEPDRNQNRTQRYSKQDMRNAYWAGYCEQVAAPQPEAQPHMVQALKDAIEGECDGLSITDAHAKAILEYVLAAPSAQAPQPEAQPHRGEFKALDPDIAKFISDNLWELAAPSAQAEPYRCPAKRGEDPQVCGRVRCQLGRKCADEVQAEQGGK